MPNFFKKYPEGTLIALAIVFSALALGCFIFGVTSAVHGVAEAFSINKIETQSAGLNLPAAAKLDLRGLVPQ